MSKSYLEQFSALINHKINVTINEDSFEFLLLELEIFQAVMEEKTESYKLLFASPFDTEKYYVQGVYQVALNSEEHIPVFMVPIGPNAEGNILYEAIFN